MVNTKAGGNSKIMVGCLIMDKDGNIKSQTLEEYKEEGKQTNGKISE